MYLPAAVSRFKPWEQTRKRDERKSNEEGEGVRKLKKFMVLGFSRGKHDKKFIRIERSVLTYSVERSLFFY